MTINIIHESLLSEIRHQDQQMWQMNVYFFAIHAGLFIILRYFLECCNIFFLTLSFFVSIVGIIGSVLWWLSSNKIQTYISDRIEKCKEYESKYKELPRIWSKGVIGGSVKEIYITLFPLLSLIGWLIVLIYNIILLSGNNYIILCIK